MSNQKPKIEKVKKQSVEKTDNKTDRFIRVVGKRATFVIDKLLIMGKVLQNPQNYEYTMEQIEAIFKPIRDLTLELENRFIENISISEKKEQYKIEL